MKRKIITLLLCGAMVCSLAACGSTADNTSADTTSAAEETAESSASEETADSSAAAETSAENESADVSATEETTDASSELADGTVEITVSSTYAGDQTEEDLKADIAAGKYISATIDDDEGSVTYIMTEEQHDQMLQETAENIRKGLAEVPGSNDYPDVTSVDVNDDFTVFTVTTKNTELSTTESLLYISLYMYGGYYQEYAGTELEDITVKYVNADSGDVIDEEHYKDLGLGTMSN